MVVPQGMDLMTPYVLLEQEDWFESEIEFVRRLLLPGMVVVDVGANYGTYALCAAARVGEEGRVIAFEPASVTANYLGRSVAANSFHNVRIFQCALSDHIGQATLSISANSELNTLQEKSGSKGELVRLRTLDDCFEEFGSGSIDFLKLDAEGEESRVLRGGGSTLERTSPLIMFELKHVDRVNLELLGEFSRIGYRLYSLIPGLNMLAPFDSGAPLDPFQLNLFAAKDDCAAGLEKRGLLALRSDFELPLQVLKDDPWYDHVEKRAYARRFLARWNGFRRRAPGILHSILCTLPYTRRMLERWNPVPAGGDPEFLVYRDALDDYARAYSPETPAAYRPAFLARSLAILSNLLAGKPATFSRLSTWARVAGDAGRRDLAGKIAAGMIDAVDSGQLACDANEPFLPATGRFDELDPGREPTDWFVSSLLEAATGLSHYSSYFSGIATLPYLERLAESAYQSPEMERRRQLVRMQAGLQRGPESRLILSAQTTDNLNSEYWGRDSH